MRIFADECIATTGAVYVRIVRGLPRGIPFFINRNDSFAGSGESNLLSWQDHPVPCRFKNSIRRPDSALPT